MQHHSSSLTPPLRLAVEFNDGTCSPLPADDGSFDAYALAWHCMSESEEAEIVAGEGFQHFMQQLHEGSLTVREADLSSAARWKALGFFLTRCKEVHSLRFHGVNLQIADYFPQMKQTMLSSSLQSHAYRHRKRHKDASGGSSAGGAQDSYATTGDSASSSAGSSAANVSPTPSPAPSPRQEWTGGWGVELPQRRREPARSNLTLRHISFVQNQLGTQMHYSREELKAHHAQHPPCNTTLHPPSATGARGSAHPSRPSALDNVVSMLLICELLESASILRNNLDDQHAVMLTEELLVKHPSLRKLSLRWNGITGNGAQQVERILKDFSSTLQSNDGREIELDLAFNRIDLSNPQQLFSDPAIQTDLPVSCSAPSSAARTAEPTPALSCSAPQPGSSPHLQSTNTPRARISVNLRSQMPHSAALLAHYLRRTSVHSHYQWRRASKEGGDACASAANWMQQQSQYFAATPVH